MSAVEWYLGVAAALTVLGGVRMLLARDAFVRLIALNVASGGGLLVFGALAARGSPPDTVAHALALTGIVITVAFTGVGLALLRHMEDLEHDAAGGTQGPDAAPPAGPDRDEATG